MVFEHRILNVGPRDRLAGQARIGSTKKAEWDYFLTWCHRCDEFCAPVCRMENLGSSFTSSAGNECGIIVVLIMSRDLDLDGYLIQFYPDRDRFIPPREILFKRLDLVHHVVYGAILDAKTRQHMIGPEAFNAAKKLRAHIAGKCVSDSPDINFHFKSRKHLVCGTNDLEGYHFHMRRLTSSCISPKLSHSSLLKHNFRWNVHQEIENHGLDPLLRGSYCLMLL